MAKLKRMYPIGVNPGCILFLFQMGVPVDAISHSGCLIGHAVRSGKLGLEPCLSVSAEGGDRKAEI